MASVTETARRLGPDSNQEALVRRVTKKTVRPVRHTIPGGKTISDQLDKDGLESACYNWLRRVREFTDVTISLARNPADFKTRERRVEDFQKSPYGFAWHERALGKKEVGKRVAGYIFDLAPIAVILKADGIYVLEDVDKKLVPGSDEWEPYLEFIPVKRDEWRTQM